MDEEELFRLQLEEINRMEEEERIRQHHRHPHPHHQHHHHPEHQHHRHPEYQHQYDEDEEQRYNDIYSQLRREEEELEEAIKKSMLLTERKLPDFLKTESKILKNECMICMEDSDEQMCVLKCNHTFHCECLRNLIANNIVFKCPLCQKEFDKIYHNYGQKKSKKRVKKSKKRVKNITTKKSKIKNIKLNNN